MTTEQIVDSTLEHLAAAYGGHSQYRDTDIGHAFAGQINNNGLVASPDELAGYAVQRLSERWGLTEEAERAAHAEIVAACVDWLSRRNAAVTA